ncbi:MAG: glycosyltransferase family 4 protein [Herpetosiphon sp.]
MRILQTSNGYPPTASAGVEIYTATLSQELAKHHDIFVFCREGGTDQPDGTIIDEQQGSVQICRVVNNFRHAYEFADFHHNTTIDGIFRAYVERVRPDLIHIQHCVGLSTSLLSIAQAMGIPYLVTLHDYWYLCPKVQLVDRQGNICAGPLKGLNCRRCAWWPIDSTLLQTRSYRLAEPILRRLPMQIAERAVKPFTDFVIRNPEQNVGLLPSIERAWVVKQLLLQVPLFLTPSYYLRQVYIDYGVPSERIHVLPLGLDKTRWRVNNGPRAQRAAGPLRLGYIGTLMHHKGVHILLEAMAKLAPGIAKLTIWGYGEPGATYVDELKAQASADVVFAGRYENALLPSILSNLDAIIIPSIWHETFSIVAREALLAGVPVVSSNVGALPEILHDGLNGALFPMGNSEALANILRRMASGSLQLYVDGAVTDNAIMSVEQHVYALEGWYERVMTSSAAPSLPHSRPAATPGE